MLNLISIFVAIAHAQEAANAAPKQPSTFESLVIPMLAFFLIFYFLVLRPQANKAKEVKSFLDSLKKGDEVLTTSGILGTIVGISDSFVDLKISENSRIKILKSSLSGPFKPTVVAKADKKK